MRTTEMGMAVTKTAGNVFPEVRPFWILLNEIIVMNATNVVSLSLP